MSTSYAAFWAILLASGVYRDLPTPSGRPECPTYEAPIIETALAAPSLVATGSLLSTDNLNGFGTALLFVSMTAAIAFSVGAARNYHTVHACRVEQAVFDERLEIAGDVLPALAAAAAGECTRWWGVEKRIVKLAPRDREMLAGNPFVLACRAAMR